MPDLFDPRENASPAGAKDAPADAPTQSKDGISRGRLLNNDETTDWGNTLSIEEKPALTEQNALRKEFEDAHTPDEADAPADTPAENADTAVLEPESNLPEEVIETVDDPGEFTPGDYSFDVVTYDAEGNKPKTVKVHSIEEWEKLLEAEPNLGNSLAVNRAFRAAQKMEQGFETDRRSYEAAVKEYNDAVEAQNIREGRTNTIYAEMQYLMNKGELPKLTQEEMTGLDWSNPDVLKAHPNIKAHNELLAYMRKENTSRVKAGLAPLSSALDAYNAMTLDGRRQADIQAKKSAGEARKAAGSRVASGSSTPLSAASPRGIAVGRVGDLSRLAQDWN